MTFKRVVWLIVNVVLLLMRENSAQDIYCNQETKPWKQAMADCILIGGHVVPYVTGLGNQISDLQLKPGLTVWTPDYIKLNEVRDIASNDQDPNHYRCGYLKVVIKNRHVNVVNQTYGDCFQNRYVICRICNRGCSYIAEKGKWASEEQPCHTMWDGSGDIDIHNYVPDGVATVWIPNLHHFTNEQITEKHPFLDDDPVLCGLYEADNPKAGLQYTSCKREFISLCRFDNTATKLPIKYTESCFSTNESPHPTQNNFPESILTFTKQSTQTPNTKRCQTTSHNHNITSQSLSSSSPNATEQLAIVNTTAVSQKKVSFTVDTTSQTSNIASGGTDAKTSLSSKGSRSSQSTANMHVNSDQETQDTGAESGHGLEIGLSVSAVVVLVIIISVVVIVKRRRPQKNRRQEHIGVYQDNSVNFKPSPGNGRREVVQSDLTYESNGEAELIKVACSKQNYENKDGCDYSYASINGDKQVKREHARKQETNGSEKHHDNDINTHEYASVNHTFGAERSTNNANRPSHAKPATGADGYTLVNKNTKQRFHTLQIGSDKTDKNDSSTNEDYDSTLVRNGNTNTSNHTDNVYDKMHPRPAESDQNEYDTTTIILDKGSATENEYGIGSDLNDYDTTINLQNQYPPMTENVYNTCLEK